ncbi:MAG: long-chain fatty acid--CoA ligase [Rhodovibrionaceae bacterium]
MFFRQAKVRADTPFLWEKRDGHYRSLSWREVDDRVRRLSLALRRMGLQRGERIVLVAENRPEWFIADLAILAAGGITVPAYTTYTESDHRHILTNSEAVGAIVSGDALNARLLPAANKAPKCKWVLGMEPLDCKQSSAVEIHHWDAAIAAAAEDEDDVEAYCANLERGDTACFIYTSGTGGTPKGVMLSHGNILCNCLGAYDLLQELGLEDEVFLSFLPLSHSYEHTAGQFFPMTIGAQIYYAEGVESLLANLAEARPTIMTAVPRLYESMYQRLQRGLLREKPLKQKLFKLTEEIGTKRYRDPKSLTLWERFIDLFLDKLVRDKVRQRFGGRLKAMVSGGAALNPDIGIFFTALGLRLLQGYGQTEAAPVIAANRTKLVKMHTVGPPLKGVEVRIAEDGEILARGEMVMKGYWRDEEATAAALQDGWLHTGDVGQIDEDGYIQITDRKKDIVVLSGGDNVSPARVEGYLTLQTQIDQALVFGDKKPALAALIVPDEEWLKSWAHDNGKSHDLSELAEDPELRKALAASIATANEELSNLERVRRFMVVPERFTVENEMMTATMKLRRHVIRQAYGEAMERLFDQKPHT